jgi:hypothetical protein
VTAARSWIAHRVGRAPAELRDQILRGTEGVSATASLPDALADAGQAALDRALAAPADRRTALDLLAADALITLALLAQAEVRPEELGRFAGALVLDHSVQA